MRREEILAAYERSSGMTQRDFAQREGISDTLISDRDIRQPQKHARMDRFSNASAEDGYTE